MLEYLNKLPNDFRDMLNLGIMNKDYDSSVVEHVVNAFRGFELFPNIKILDYEFDGNEINYDINDHVVRRNTNKNKAVKNISETRCGILYIDIEISGVDRNGVTEVRYVKKPIIIPIQDEKGYYLIRGKKSYIIYQLVDKMLYPSFGAVTIKSLMPIYVKTMKKDIAAYTGETFTVPIYSINIFKAAINVLMVYSHLGITKTLNFLEVDRFIRVLSKQPEYPIEENTLYFECGKKSDIAVAVRADIFEKEIYVRSIVGCLIALFDETKILFENIDNWEEWMIIVGGKNTIRRGQYQHLFYKRLLDDITRNELKINYHDKQNIYYLLRWIIQNFHVLWAKDNLSMMNKRLRCSEYASSFITAEVSKRVNRLAMKGDNATIQDFLKSIGGSSHNCGNERINLSLPGMQLGA